MRPATPYDEPFFWWGPSWQAPAPHTLRELLRDGTIDAWLGATLWAVLARRKSLAVVARPSGAGKTTVLTALLELLPPATRRIHLRGCFETFAFLADPAVIPERTVLLANEMSPHLPIYLWGPAAARFLQAGNAGYGLLATAHAESATELVSLLAGSPLRIPAREIAAFEFVAVVAKSAQSASGRRVSGLWRLQGTRDGVEIERFSGTHSHNISLEPLHNLPSSPWFPQHEILKRHRLLKELCHGSRISLPGVLNEDAAAARDAP